MRAVGSALEGFRRATAALHRVTRHASRGEYGLADALLLHAIAKREIETPGGIAAHTGLTSGSVTSLLDRFESAGLVRRERSASDRRVVLVRLTRKGRSSLAGTMERAHREIDDLFASWQAREIEALGRLLARLARARARP